MSEVGGACPFIPELPLEALSCWQITFDSHFSVEVKMREVLVTSQSLRKIRVRRGSLGQRKNPQVRGSLGQRKDPSRKQVKMKRLGTRRKAVRTRKLRRKRQGSACCQVMTMKRMEISQVQVKLLLRRESNNWQARECSVVYWHNII